MVRVTSPIADERSLRERLIGAAIRFTSEHGWSALTMAKLAHRVGVSRQTVYNELGSKPQLAEAMVMTELARFLRVVDSAFTAHQGQLVDAVREAARSVLVLAEDSPLLRAVLASRQGAQREAPSDLLPLLTTNSAPLLDMAREMIRQHVAAYDTGLAPERLEGLIDMVVRLVLSHVMQPGGRPEDIAESIAWIAGRVVGAVPAVGR